MEKTIITPTISQCVSGQQCTSPLMITAKNPNPAKIDIIEAMHANIPKQSIPVPSLIEIQHL